jgi:ABC-type amino acid transport substrate-binding protein
MRKSRVWIGLIALMLATAAIAISGCGDGDDETANGGSGLGLIEDGTLLVGTDIPYPPFEQGSAANPSGFEIDIVNEIAERLGLTAQYRDTAFDTIFRDLAQGKFDMVAAASTITPERQQTVDFSDPYYEAEQALVVVPDSGVATVEDLDGATVGAQDGTTGEAYANDETGAASVRGYPEGPDAINALRAGQVDAVIIDQPVAQDASEKAGGIEIVTTIPTGELFGFPVAKDNDALLERVNEELAALKEDGTLAELYEKYFDIQPPRSVLSGTTAPE